MNRILPTLPRDTYRLDKMQATPFPNRLLELTFRLPETSIRLLCVIVRYTLGWQAGKASERRASVFLTNSQLRSKIGRSTPASISQALDSLVLLGIVEACTAGGKPLATAAERRAYRGPLRLRIARSYVESS
jgi:hypothetical protein